MPKNFFKKYMPDPHRVREHKHLKAFGTLLHDPNLWHFNRRSVAGAFSLGLFNAFMPVPFQMLLSAIGAVFFRVNLPIAVGTVWITNPLTIPPIFYFTYLVGNGILGTPEQRFEFELSYQWMTEGLLAIWQPFLLGCFVTGIVAALVGYVTVRVLWRLQVVNHMKRRLHKREQKLKQD